MLHAVIMAGGSGTRFWPQSRLARPKQLLNLLGDRTMIQATVDRVSGLVPPERLLIATTSQLAAAVAEQLPQLRPEAILAEPCPRDTAPCIGLAATLVAQHDPDATLIVLPSDHVIAPPEEFRRAVQFAAGLIEERPAAIVTFGVRPTYPAESFGYIERGPQLPSSGAEDPPAYRALRFREKPNAATAEQYLAQGNFLWNAGIFVWKAATICQALAEHQPAMYARLRTIAAAVGSPQYDEVLSREFAAIDRISIDFAVMEHAADVIVVEVPFQWDDVGSWQALTRLAGSDDQGNTFLCAKYIDICSKGTIVHSSSDHLVVTLGLRDCLVVHTPDATLVANKHDEESVRKVVKLLRDKDWQQYL